MAKKVAASRLKVFQAQFGFYDSIVAAPSQPAALRAWGTHQNLFAAGQASLTTDAAAVEAALKHPNVPLRRAVGTDGAFEVEPTGIPVVPDAAKPKAARHASRASKPKQRQQKPRPDRSALNAAERALVELEARRKEEETDFQRRQRELDTEVAKADKQYQERRRELDVAVAAARKAYRDAGGEN